MTEAMPKNRLIFAARALFGDRKTVPLFKLVIYSFFIGAFWGCGSNALFAEERKGLYHLTKEAIGEGFPNPPNEYRLVQYQLNDKVLERYPRYGIGGFMAFFYQELYQQNAPERIASLVDAANQRNMPVWLADDFGYPSGMAGGRVVAENPDFEVRGMGRIVKEGNGPDAIVLDLPEGAERFLTAMLYPMVDGAPNLSLGEPIAVSGDRVDAHGLTGPWRLSAFVSVIRDNNVQAQSTMAQFGHTGRYPDLLNRQAVASFLSHMHEPIVAGIPDLSSKVEGFYTNEPQLMQLHWSIEKEAPFACVPWNSHLPAKFREMHGYELAPTLDALFEGNELVSRRTRIHFYQTVAELFTDSFARQIRDWCADRGIASSGHFLLNEYLSMHVGAYGDLMKFASEFDLPALDIGIPNPDRFHDFPYEQTKFFSSVAAWKERDAVICLLDPIIGGGGLLRLSPAMPLLLNSTNRAFLHGANLFSSYLPLDPVDTSDARGRGQRAAGYTPEEFAGLNDYIGRIALVLRGARRETAVALYYPIEMFQAEYKPSRQHWHKLVPDHRERQAHWEGIESALLTADIDYNIVHPEALVGGLVSEGAFRVGTASYRYLVMPGIEMLSREAMDRIHEFEAAGGVVLWVDARPQAGIYGRDDAGIQLAFEQAPVIVADGIASRIHEPYASSFSLRFEPGPDRLAVARFYRENQKIYFLVNISGERLNVSARGSSGEKATLLDPTTGEIRQVDFPASIEIAEHRSLLIMQ
jgi:hypothetical protein